MVANKKPGLRVTSRDTRDQVLSSLSVVTDQPKNTSTSPFTLHRCHLLRPTLDARKSDSKKRHHSLRRDAFSHVLVGTPPGTSAWQTLKRRSGTEGQKTLRSLEVLVPNLDSGSKLRLPETKKKVRKAESRRRRSCSGISH